MKSIWIVTYPDGLSVIEDIMFECDGVRLERQFKGGLTGAEIEGFYATEAAAFERARDLISAREQSRSGK